MSPVSRLRGPPCNRARGFCTVLKGSMELENLSCSALTAASKLGDLDCRLTKLLMPNNHSLPHRERSMTWHGWLTDERRARSTRILLLDGVTRRNIVWPNQTRPNTLPRKLARQIYMQSTVNSKCHETDLSFCGVGTSMYASSIRI